MATWRPPERIKFVPIREPWPDAETAGRSLLFSPIDVGPARLTSRTWVPAMVPWRASEDGEVTASVLQWYERFARGRPGALVVEATGVRDVPSGPLLRIGHDRFLPGLASIVETVRRASGGQTRVFIQIIDFLAIRRRPVREKYLSQYLSIQNRHRDHLGVADAPESLVRERLASLTDEQLQQVLSPREWESLQQGYRERVTDLELPAIRELPAVLPDIFAAAARRAEQAGFDGVELHYAHAYTMASFLSARNTRNDGYGGEREARLRLPLEVLAAVRSAVGSRIAVGCRMLAEECIEGGNGVEDATFIAARLAAGGMDFISLSRGGKFEDAAQPKVGEAAYPYTGRSGYECMPSYCSDAKGPFGRNREPAALVREAIRAAGSSTPTILAGGVHHFNQAEKSLELGEADIIGMARQALADPDWFAKVRSGRGETIRTCLYTNYCEALDQRHREVTCELWDRLDLDEPGIMRTKDGKRRLVPP